MMQGRQEMIGRNIGHWTEWEKNSVDYCGLPFWEAVFLLFGQNCEAGGTYGITKTGMKGLQMEFCFVLQF